MSLKSILREVAEIAIGATVRCVVEVVVDRLIEAGKSKLEKGEDEDG